MPRRDQVHTIPVLPTTKPAPTTTAHVSKMLSNFGNALPYSCLYLDLDWRDLLCAIKECLTLLHSITRDQVIENIKKIWTTPQNPNHVLPCLSVRTGLDLYLQAKSFPQGSEIVVSAITIPDIPHILHHHGLQVVSLDVDIETTAPKIELLEELITERTVALLLAHIYGKVFDLSPFVEVAKKYNLAVIEDSAEGFCGFDYLGHPNADISLFSFGTIKYCSCMGGAIAKIQNSADYKKMNHLQQVYHPQPSSVYLQKVIKCCMLYIVLDCPKAVKPALFIAHQLNCDYKRNVTRLIRSFPNNLIDMIQFQPSMALLLVMLRRFQSFRPNQITICRLKGEYVSSRLPSTITVVGHKAPLNCYWLFPIVVHGRFEWKKTLAMEKKARQRAREREDQKTARLNSDFLNRQQRNANEEAVRRKEIARLQPAERRRKLTQEESCHFLWENPDLVMHRLNALGIEAHRSSTQLTFIESDKPHNHPPEHPSVETVPYYPHEANYMMNNTVYLPVNKGVPFHVLDKICDAVKYITKKDSEKSLHSLQPKILSKL